MTATNRWKEMVETEHAQSDRMRGAVPAPADHWTPYAQQFRADPRRTDDLLVNRLLEEVEPHHTVLDVGAGGGRLALPLATKCRWLVAVEPSMSMAAVLRQQAADCGIQNVTLVESIWDEADVDAADIVLCAHVLYVVPEVESFVRKLDARARNKVLVVLYQAPPQSQIYPLWGQVHNEERIPLPSLPQFLEVLEQLKIEAHVDMLPPQPPRGFDNHQQALEQLARRLYLAPGSPQMTTLANLLPELLEEDGGTWTILGSQPLRPGLVSWQPNP